MTIERLDPLELDDATADRCAEISTASAQAGGLDLAPMTGAVFSSQATYTHDDRPLDALWLARDRDGDSEIVGHASMDLPTWDNQHMALVFCSVHPYHQGRGIGTQLLEAQVEAVREAGRSMLLTFAFRDSPPARLLTEHGFEVAQDTAQRRLRPQGSTTSRSRRMPTTPRPTPTTTSSSASTAQHQRSGCPTLSPCSSPSATHH